MIQTPPSQTPLPGELQQRVENALNLVTSLEAEQARLTKMCTVETQKINALHEEKKSLEVVIESLEANKDAMRGDEESSKTVLKELEARKILANNELADLIARIEIADSELKSKILERENQERGIAQAEKEINERLQDLARNEDAHSVKVEKLKKALE